jgi:hypothetical protein
MSELGRIIAKHVRTALREAGRLESTNVAVSTSGGEPHSVSVYSDQDVTIVQRDGKTRVIRGDEDVATPVRPQVQGDPPA